MPGAWELKEQNSVLVAILHVEQTTIAWSFGLRNLIVPGGVIGLTGMPYCMARNVACQRALEGGFTHLFFLDSDVIPPRDAILRLRSHNAPIVSGLYCRRSPPHGIPVMIRGRDWVTEFPPNSLIEVDLVGSGCLLIHRQLLEALPPPKDRPEKRWFHWKVDRAGLEGQGECLSEDFVFCKRVREELGIPILVDTGVQCKHIGYAEAGYGSFRPLDATPVT